MRGLLLATIVVPGILLAQQTQPSPRVGWDSLRARIEVPEIFIRAAIRLAVSVAIEVDSTDRLLDVTYEPFNTLDPAEPSHGLSSLDSAFCTAIRRACWAVPWKAGTLAGGKKRMVLHMPFIFITRPYDSRQSDPHLIILDVLRPKVETTHTY
jgi:hypothetical protein